MDIGAFLFSLALVVLVAVYVFQPLRSPEQGKNGRSGRELSALMAERDRVLDSIQEIDMDYAMGKVPEDYYRAQRGLLAAEGAKILREIDELQPDLPAAPADTSLSPKEADLEAAVAQLRGKGIPTEISESESGACPECGQSIYHGDRFCSNCGAELEEHVA